jgi:hypothetical protein
MPKRSNIFQDVVAILHRHLAGAIEVEESAELLNRVTGEPPEADVGIRSEIAGHTLVLGIEATMQKGSSPWVEGMIGKRADFADRSSGPHGGEGLLETGTALRGVLRRRLDRAIATGLATTRGLPSWRSLSARGRRAWP